jgi:hypothetical protein
MPRFWKNRFHSQTQHKFEHYIHLFFKLRLFGIVPLAYCQLYFYLLLPVGEPLLFCIIFVGKLVMLLVGILSILQFKYSIYIQNVCTYLLGVESTNKVMCLVPLITWLEDVVSLNHLSHMFPWIIIVEVLGNLYRFQVILDTHKKITFTFKLQALL